MNTLSIILLGAVFTVLYFLSLFLLSVNIAF